MAILKIKNALGEFVNIVALKGDKGDTGEQGIQGPKGDKGDKPAHRWIDTSLQFEKPDGTWGDAVNLKGESGDGSGNMHTSIYDTTGKSTDIFNYVDTGLSGKVDNARVLTDVPANAKFTDTVTTINGKTGAIAKADITALGIPAQDTVYTHPATHSADMIVDGTTNKAYTATEKNKLAGIATNANNYTHPGSGTNPHGTTKSDVGLGNVDNVKQMPIAGGTFTGVAVAQTNTSYTTRQLRNVILSTSDPSGGSNGDIWIKYT